MSNNCVIPEAEYHAMKAEIEQLKAQIYVLKDERLRTYDGMTERLKRYREALESIAKKRPHAVDRNEAADMACEFSLIAREALNK